MCSVALGSLVENIGVTVFIYVLCIISPSFLIPCPTRNIPHLRTENRVQHVWTASWSFSTHSSILLQVNCILFLSVYIFVLILYIWLHFFTFQMLSLTHTYHDNILKILENSRLPSFIGVLVWMTKLETLFVVFAQVDTAANFPARIA